MAIRSRSLIKRFPLPLYHRIKEEDKTSSPWGGDSVTTVSITTEVAQDCTLQPVDTQKLSAGLEGLSVNDIFVLRTNTPIYTAIEGTTLIGSGIYLPPCYFTPAGSTFVPPSIGGYYNCLEVKRWNNGVINHYEAMVVKTYTLEDGYYPVDKVSLTAADMDTVEKLKNGDWITGWEQ